MARDAMSAGGGPVDLGPWAGFPLAQDPRPVILLDAPVQLGRGFVDAASKLAWLAGAVVADVRLPPGLLDLVIERHNEQTAPTVLHVRSIQRCSGEFRCDRGMRPLPAYRLAVTGLRDDCVVLDPDLECWWPPRAQWSSPRSRPASARVEDDGVTIHFPAFGGVLTEFHRAEFIEYDTCVVGRAVTTERHVAPGTAVRLVGIVRHVIGRLQRPLAGRVLLDNDGQPLAVVPARSEPA